MSSKAQGDAPQTASGEDAKEVNEDAHLGPPVRVKLERDGLALDVEPDGISASAMPSSSPVVPQRIMARLDKFNLKEHPVFAKQISDNLSAAAPREVESLGHDELVQPCKKQMILLQKTKPQFDAFHCVRRGCVRNPWTLISKNVKYLPEMLLIAGKSVKNEEKMDGDTGRPVSVRRGGVSFDIGLVGHWSPVVPKRVGGQSETIFSLNEPLRCAKKVHEKLAAAEARRDYAINELRIRGAEKTQKLTKARQRRWWMQKKAIDGDFEVAQAQMAELRDSQVEVLKKQTRMSDEQPSKADVQAALKRLRGLSSNKACFDCSAKNPTWASVTYGIFLCIDCSAVHRSLGVHLSFVRSTQLDTNWTWMQLRAMQLGGNAAARDFFQQHGCTTTDAQQKYNSRAAQLYKDKLAQMCSQAMKIHGTKLYLEGAGGDHTAEESQAGPKKDDHLDFFQVHTVESQNDVTEWQHTKTKAETARNGASQSNSNDGGLGPSVAAMNLEETPGSEHSSPIGKHTLGSKKPAKKTGKLGAQKVTSDFDDLEKQADAAEKRRLESIASRNQFQVASPVEEANSLSTRLTYQDVDAERKKEEERIKKADPKKAQQLERLGMGVGARGKISHSVLSDMTKIEQDRPANSRNDMRSYGAMDRQPKDDDWDRLDSYSSSRSGRDEQPKSSFDDYVDRLSTKDRNKYDYEDNNTKTNSYQSSSDSSSRYGKKIDTAPAPTEDAQKKFGNAKSISSDMYFGNERANDWETKSNMNRFEGKNSISSAEYFGTGASSPTNSSSSYSSRMPNLNLQTPDLTELKEGVRQGITKVAGRLSSMASTVVNNIQERYS